MNRICLIRCLIVMSAVTLASGAFAQQARPESWQAPTLQEELVRLDDLLSTGDLAQVIEIASALLETNADDPYFGHQLQARLGLALLRSGRVAEAVHPLEEAVRARPQDVDYHRNLATALMRLGRVGRATTELRQAVDLAPDDAQLRREYGQALTSLRAWPEAEKQLLVARTLCDDCREGLTALADLYLRWGRDDAAVEPLRRLYAADRDPHLRRELAFALHRLADYRAVTDLLGDLPPRELSQQELHVLADADLKTDLTGRAEAWARDLAAGSLLPAVMYEDAGFWATVSLCLQRGGEPAEALVAIDQALKLKPDDVIFLNNKVALLQRLGRQDEAKALWKRVLELDPQREEEQP